MKRISILWVLLILTGITFGFTQLDPNSSMVKAIRSGRRLTGRDLLALGPRMVPSDPISPRWRNKQQLIKPHHLGYRNMAEQRTAEFFRRERKRRERRASAGRRRRGEARSGREGAAARQRKAVRAAARARGRRGDFARQKAIAAERDKLRDKGKVAKNAEAKAQQKDVSRLKDAWAELNARLDRLEVRIAPHVPPQDILAVPAGDWGDELPPPMWHNHGDTTNYPATLHPDWSISNHHVRLHNHGDADYHPDWSISNHHVRLHNHDDANYHPDHDADNHHPETHALTTHSDVGVTGATGRVIWWNGTIWAHTATPTKPAVLVFDDGDEEDTVRWLNVDTLYKGIYRNSSGDMEGNWVQAHD